MTTKKKIAEQVSRDYARYIDKENPRPVLEYREAMVYVEQAINEVLKVHTIQGLKEGVIDIPESNAAIYTIAVSTDSQGAYVDLTAHPISLPNDMGVWSVYKSGDPSIEYIPLPKSMYSLLTGTIIADVEQKTTWTRTGKRIRFSNDITTSAYGSVSNVDVELLCADFSQLTDSELLPLSADYEAQVTERALQLISRGQFSLNELKDGDNN